MAIEVRFNDEIGHGVDLVRIDFGFNYFNYLTETTYDDRIENVYTTSAFNGCNKHHRWGWVTQGCADAGRAFVTCCHVAVYRKIQSRLTQGCVTAVSVWALSTVQRIKGWHYLNAHRIALIDKGCCQGALVQATGVIAHQHECPRLLKLNARF